jgi:diacylglycerol O-acyltransferase / wax synthase
VLVKPEKDRRVAMPTTRLSPLDASFLAVESPTAHMHVGWATCFRPPESRPRPGFDDLFEHIESRLSRGQRFRQRLAGVPLGLNAPLWIDDERFVASHRPRRLFDAQRGDRRLHVAPAR